MYTYNFADMAWYSPLVGTSVTKLTVVGFVYYMGVFSFSLFSLLIPEAFKYVRHLFKLVMGTGMEARKNLFFK